MLCALDDYMREQLQGVDRNVINAQAEVQLVNNERALAEPARRNRYAVLLREAEQNLRDAQSMAYEVRRRVVPAVVEMRSIIEGAIRDGLFAEPMARQAEDLQIARERVERLYAARSAALREEVDAELREHGAGPNPEAGVAGTDDMDVDAAAPGAANAYNSYLQGGDRERMIESIITAVFEEEFTFPGMSVRLGVAPGEIAPRTVRVFGNRSIETIPDREVELLWRQLENYTRATRAHDEGSRYAVMQSERIEMLAALRAARSVRGEGQWPTAALEGQMNEIESLADDELRQYYLEYLSWDATPEEMRTLDHAIRDRMVDEIVQATEEGFRYPGYAEDPQGRPMAFGSRLIAELPDVEVKLLFDQFKLNDSRFGSRSYSVPELTNSERDDVIRTLQAAIDNGWRRERGTTREAMSHLEDYWLQCMIAEFRSWSAVPASVRAGEQQVRVPAYSPLPDPMPFPNVDVPAAMPFPASPPQYPRMSAAEQPHLDDVATDVDDDGRSSDGSPGIPGTP